MDDAKKVNLAPAEFDLEKIDYYKIYESIWRNMERENTLINYRAGWCIAFTGGIFAAETIFANIALHYEGTTLTDLCAMCALSFFASFICHNSELGVGAALTQIDYLRGHYSRFGDDQSSFFEQKLGLPRPFGDNKTHERGHRTAKIFPKALSGIWCVVGLLQSLVAILLLIHIIEFKVLPPTSTERSRLELYPLKSQQPVELKRDGQQHGQPSAPLQMEPSSPSTM